MNNSTNNFTLFPNCTNTKNLDSLDIAKCCIQNCNINYDLCEKSCTNNIDCKNKCISVNKNLCMDICQIASKNLQIENDFYECAKENGCMKNMELPTLSCVMEHSKNIDNCIRSKWLPNKPNLNKYTNFFKELPFEKKTLIDTQEIDNTEKSNNIPKDNTIKYILIGISITIILSIVIISLN